MHRKKHESNTEMTSTAFAIASHQVVGAAGNHPMAPDASKPGRRYAKKTSGTGAT